MSAVSASNVALISSQCFCFALQIIASGFCSVFFELRYLARSGHDRLPTAAISHTERTRFCTKNTLKALLIARLVNNKNIKALFQQCVLLKVCKLNQPFGIVVAFVD